jgi:hypothetical protein
VTIQQVGRLFVQSLAAGTPQESSLLGLPIELCNNIYEPVFHDARGSKDLGLLLASCYTYHEAVVIAFETTTFDIDTRIYDFKSTKRPWYE